MDAALQLAQWLCGRRFFGALKCEELAHEAVGELFSSLSVHRQGEPNGLTNDASDATGATGTGDNPTIGHRRAPWS